ncbi:FG-GAP repeat domain-containing protein [Paenibacillus hamazuiensis]|uniref:FG-GAP repeat domain-containing protein n=1 Tax=Paenibacillus hamazuiensis TaxID=2936508 RepID=UPI00200F6133|nr:VCBS repeat-containing protein [Paenibacillus hamazuiensis]
MKRTSKLFRLWIYVACVIAIVGAASFFIERDESVRLLYATNGADADPSAYDHFRQSLVANVRTDKASLEGMSLSQLQRYDAVYLDPGLHEAGAKYSALLQSYVEKGGYLFLENVFAADFPPAFLGGQAVVNAPAVSGKPQFAYPETDANLRGLQDVFRRFAADYFKRTDMSAMPGFTLGQGLVPSTAQTLVSLQDVSLVTMNRYGKGSVLLSSAFLPNRYFITGADLKSGMDPKLGFSLLAQQVNAAKKPVPGALYFNREQLPLEPYYNYSFAAANALFRDEFAAYVSKRKLGYSIKKVLGPYGRPAMAHQNHFEAIQAIRDGEGIQWAELLKKYHQIPSFSLVRSAFTWGHWQESIVVHLNAGSSAEPKFAGETPNSFYSSGTRLMAGGKEVALADYPEYKSLGDPIDKPYRAAPAMADADGDGRPDLIAGSADGRVMVYRNAGVQPDAYRGQSLPPGLAAPDAFEPPQPLRLAGGAALTAAGGFAAVAAGDLSGDGRADLALGDGTGAVTALLGGADGFAAPAALTAGGAPLRVAGPAAPAIADVDGDGVPDLAVGGGDGRVTWFRGIKGRPLAFDEGRELARVGAAFAAPSLRDMNGDGRPDLVVGTVEGDLRVFLQEAGGTWKPSGVVEGATTNQLGSKALVGGHNAVPLWYDLNHDGKDDLIVGQLEFGMPVTIDDPQFPYKEQLNAFIQYSKDNHLELYPHVFVHNFTGDEQEKQEIALQRKAFDTLGIPWGTPGTNQHTWRINHPDRTQTFRNERDAGMWFNFGYRPSFAPNDPRLGTTPEYIWGLPFLLNDPAVKQPMLLYTPAPVLRLDPTYSTTDLYNTYAAFDLPVDYFEHIEYHFPTRVGELLEFVKFLDTMRNKEDYNFMTEPQMAQSFLAALTSEAKVTRSWGAVAWEKLKRLAGRNPARTLTITARTDGVPDQAGGYKRALGYVIEPGAAFADRPLSTDADVWLSRGGRLYAGALDGSARVRFGAALEASRGPHLVRANVPVRLTRSGSRWTLELQAAGLQQVKLASARPIAVQGDGVEVERDDASGTYTLTRYGAETTITIDFAASP